MPELPEVETIRQQLVQKIVGKKIIRTEVFTSKITNVSKNYFIKNTQGAKFKNVSRRAKILIIELSNDSFLLCHLKLSGHLIFQKENQSLPKYTHIIFYLSGGGRLTFDDFRKFAYMKFIKNKKELDKILNKENFGPEPLVQDFTLAEFKNRLAKKPCSPVKPLLMDQTFLAGIGNIYAQEACFYAKINPRRKVATLTDKEIKDLYENLRRVLVQALKYNGSSVDAYLDIFGKPGKFVPLLKVYGREGKPCFSCKIKIKKIRIAGRGTSYCPKCQK